MKKKLNIIFEDGEILIVDKPSGLVVNRAETTVEKTLQDQIAEYLHLSQDLGIGGRAGIVHRLDRETSGLLLVAKTQRSFEDLQAQFAQRKVQKEYIALVHGFVHQAEGEITEAIGRIGKFGKFGVVEGGRQSATSYRVEGRYSMRASWFNVSIHRYKWTKSRINYLRNHARDYSLLVLFPKTGRTHQVRVHLKSLGHPLVSDLIYTPKKLLKFDLSWCLRLFLHATSIEFIHPKTKKIIKLTSPLPKELEDAILNLENIKAQRLTSND